MFEERLKELRKEKNITQNQLAAKLNMSKGTVAMWETGKRRPNFETLELMTKIFNKPMEYILGFSTEEPSLELAERTINQLGIYYGKEDLYSVIMEYLRLDVYGKKAVEGLIKEENNRCTEQNTKNNTEEKL